MKRTSTTRDRHDKLKAHLARNRLYLIVIFLFFTLSVSSVEAEVVNIYGNENLPPMGFIENGRPKGFGIEIIKVIFEDADIDYNLILVPWKRAYEMARHGKGIVFGMYWTEERSKLFDFSKSLWNETIVVVTKKGKEFPFRKISDLKGKRIGFQLGTRPGSEFEAAIANGVFDSDPDYSPAERIRRLLNGRLDAAIFNPGKASLRWHASRGGIDFNSFSVLQTPLAIRPKHIGIAKAMNQKSLLNRINSSVDKLKKNGVIAGILNRYHSDL